MNRPITTYVNQHSGLRDFKCKGLQLGGASHSRMKRAKKGKNQGVTKRRVYLG